MKKSDSLLNRIPFYILLLGVYPVLYLWMANFTKIHSYVVTRSILISLSLAIIVFLVTWLFVRPLPRAGLVAGVILLLFFSYGHVFALIDNASFFGFIFGRHRYTIPLCVLIAITGIYFILRARLDFKQATRVINLVMLIMTAFLCVQIGISAVNSIPAKKTSTLQQPSTEGTLTSNTAGRDIYYILLDGYGRSDLLKNDLNLDNQTFIQSLKEMGFIVPRCGQSNYIDTAYSMAATLNMDYLDAQGFSYQDLATQDHEKLLTPVITESLVRQKFQAMGYKFITYKSPYLFIDMPDSDVYLDAENATNPGEKIETLNFQQLFIRTTFARTAAEWLEENPERSKNVPMFLVSLISPGSVNPESSTFAGRNYKQYRQNLFQLDSLETIPDISGKKFIYAHLLVTHQPFTFTPDGEFRTEEKDSYEGYKDQIMYIDKRMIEIFQTILKKSSKSPVIILQSDHSFSDGGKRARNLQAYYFPEKSGVTIPDSFTNVNAFRMVFNTYFGEKLPLLPDKSIQIDSKYDGSKKTIPPSCSD
jgi:hypothetical protein